MNQEIHAEFVGKINPHQWEHNSEEVQKNVQSVVLYFGSGYLRQKSFPAKNILLGILLYENTKHRR